MPINGPINGPFNEPIKGPIQGPISGPATGRIGRSPARRRRLGPAALVAAAILVAGAAPAASDTGPTGANGANGGPCARQDQITVPGAELQVSACLTDLTTAGTTVSGHTDPADWAGLHTAGFTNPTGVPGIQIDGYFPDTSTLNTTHGWNHDSQFVIRLPADWTGGLVVSGAPGVREQYANDFILSDWALARGYAFASTDKGNSGVTFYRDGRRPGDAMAEWHVRMTQLAVAAKAVVAQRYHRPAETTLAAGISNGGYLVRWQLENRAHLYDGGVDWEGIHWQVRAPNLFTYLPPALRAYPRYKAGEPGAHEEMLAAGYFPGSEFLWDLHHTVYWDLTQRIYREEFDPGFDGDLEAGVPFCASGTPRCDADYDFASRPRSVKRAVQRISLTGDIRKPLITLHGTLDTLLPITEVSDVYAADVARQGRSGLFRYYRVEGGNHVDAFADLFPGQVRPLLPCFRSALVAMEGWLAGAAPPPSATLPRIAPADERTTCSLRG